MAKKLIVANWKMHFNTHQASLFLHKLQEKVVRHKDVEVVLCPNFLVLQSLGLQVDYRKFKLGAQNCYFKDEGPYTGEVAANMLRGLTKYVILGHSARRHVFGETNTMIKEKVQAVVRNNMTPILCVGETAAERADGETKHVLRDQVTAGLANLTAEEAEQVVIAYEPVWAISTEKHAVVDSIDDTLKAAEIIRERVHYLYGEKIAKAVRVLYGGSVNSSNVVDYVAQPTIDGVLVGAASLKAIGFSKIVAQTQEVVEREV